MSHQRFFITIKDKLYPIKLADGYYIIRKLTVRECMRLQTVPEDYDFSVISNSQAYKCLGNGWTCDVITHLINATQKTARRKWLDDLLGDCL
jgi:DNA (cytosine-5)-methyltransferase 3A